MLLEKETMLKKGKIMKNPKKQKRKEPSKKETNEDLNHITNKPEINQDFTFWDEMWNESNYQK